MPRTGPNAARGAPPNTPPPPGRARIAFLALAVLYETMDLAKRGRVAPSPALRLALATLYVLGDRRGEWFDRQPYISFWHEATQRDAAGDGCNAGVEASARQTMMWSDMQGIARAVGIELTSDVRMAMRKTWERSASAGGDA